MFSNWAPYLMRKSSRLSLWATSWQRRFGARLRIEFSTAHSSKGLEAEYVFVLNVVQGTRGFPSQIQDDPALQLAMPAPDPFPFAEERRLFYVAMPRARKQVRFYTLLAQPSQFLVELAKREVLTIQPIDGDALEPRPQCGAGVLTLHGGQRGAFLGCSRFPDATLRASKRGARAKPSQREVSRSESRCPCTSGIAARSARRDVSSRRTAATVHSLAARGFEKAAKPRPTSLGCTDHA
ncbi:3'-5' exonuclease [Xanthomonas hortorum]|uniref:3'-5' exonuclease n=1 Tax=Xanthomonas hortorum TaxID=56454 RepID=UPI001592DACC|nr:3'-5' exonuclease [Xanthomonas hortorum]NHF66684.1 hypothetical protein [Xanthomonas hortorum]